MNVAAGRLSCLQQAYGEGGGIERDQILLAKKQNLLMRCDVMWCGADN